MSTKDAMFSLEILKTLQAFKGAGEVRDVKCSIVGAQDINVRIEVTKKSHIKPILIKLEAKMYLNNSFKVNGIRTSKEGLNILDDKNNTYKIEVVAVDNN